MDLEGLEFLWQLLQCQSPSGWEREVTASWCSRVASFMDDTEVDRHGNGFARWRTSTGEAKLVIMAHADEVGLMISKIDSYGFLHFKELGRIDSAVLPGQRVWIKTAGGRVLGVIGRKPGPLLTEQERSMACRIEELWIDIGATSRETAVAQVAIGDPVTIAGEGDRLGEDHFSASHACRKRQNYQGV